MFQRPQDLVFTLFGDYLLRRPGSVWVGSLIALLEPLGLSDGAARTVLSRMSSKGWLTAERRGRHSFYQLTTQGRKLLEEGEERIYHPPVEEHWDGRWSLVTYSIPEDDRHLRDRLRARLSWLGFGSLGNGLWISPHDVSGELRLLATEMGIAGHLETFRAAHVGFSSDEELVRRCWDMNDLNVRYGGFVARWLPHFEECEEALAREEPSPERCYVLRFQLVHEYREFPLVDPFLPSGLLPDGWAGECSAALFQKLYDLLTEPAESFVNAVLAGEPCSSETVEAAAG